MQILSLTSIINIFRNDFYTSGILLGQAFLVIGIITIKYDSNGYLLGLVGLIMGGICFVKKWMPSIPIDERTYGILFGLALIIIPSFVFIFSERINKRRLKPGKAIEVIGICVDYEWTENTDFTKSYTPVYEFNIDNKKYTTHSRIYYAKPLLPKLGSNKKILVNPLNPDQNHIQNDKELSKATIIACAFFALLGLCVIVLVLGIISAKYLAYSIFLLQLLFILFAIFYIIKNE